MKIEGQEGEVLVDGDEIEIEIDLGDDSGDGKPEEKGDGAPKGDERLSAGNRDDGDEDRRRQDETEDEKRERRRAEGRSRREARRRYAQEDNLIIHDLTNRVQELTQRLDAAGLEKLEGKAQDSLLAAERWKREANRLNAVFARAVNESDGETAARAQAARDEAVRNAQWFESDANHSRRQLEEARQPQQRQQPGVVDDSPEAVEERNRATFLRRNPGLDVRGGDEDSRLALEIDAEVKAEGFNPSTRAYWEELEKRLGEEGLDFSKARRRRDDDGDDRREHHSQRQPRDGGGKFAGESRRESRGGPPVGGKGGGGSKNTTSIPRALMESLKEAGMWDDIKVRTQMINEYRARTKQQ